MLTPDTNQEQEPAHPVGPAPEISGQVEATPPSIVTPADSERPPEAEAKPEPETQTDSNGQFVKHSDFKRIKQRAETKGRQAALQELESQFQEAGFDSVKDALVKLSRLSEEPPEQEEQVMATTRPKVKAQKPNNNKPRPQRQRVSAEAEALLSSEKAKETNYRKWKASERRNRELKRQMAAKDAEMQLREVAVQAGVTDVDYAIRLMTRDLNGKSEDELKAFNEKEYFSGLKDTRPYLFSIKEQPATTGNTTDEAPPEPKATEVNTAAAEGGKFDARKASKEEFDSRLRQFGFNSQM